MQPIKSISVKLFLVLFVLRNQTEKWERKIEREREREKEIERECITCWCSANQIRVRLASLESNKLLSCIKRSPDRWSRHILPKLKLESNKDKSNYFEWLCTHIPFSCFSRGFYRANGTIIIMLDCEFMPLLWWWLPLGRKSSLSKRVNAIISVQIRQSYQTRATDWCHLLVVEQESWTM